MNFDLDWISAGLARQAVLTMAHFLWQAAAIGGAAILIGTLMRGATAAARYRLHVCALLLMAVCPIITFIQVAPGRGGPVPWTPSVIAPAPQAIVNPPHHAANSVAASGAVPENAKAPDAVRVESPSLSPPAQPTLVPFDWGQFAPHVVVTYLIGVAVMFVRLLSSLRGGMKLKRSAVPIEHPALAAMFERAIKRLELRPVPVIARSSDVAVPCVVGIIRPMILLPSAILSGLSPVQVEAILAHELAHLRHHDHLINLLQRMIESVLFFHPCVWMISRRIRIERENRCDDAVVRAGVSSRHYADSLLRVAELCAGAPRAELAAVGRHATLRDRILRLVGSQNDLPVRLSRVWVIVVTLIVAGGTSVLLCRRTPQAVAQAVAPTPPATAPSTAPSIHPMSIKVVDQATGNPIAGATVILRARGDYTSGPTTDAQGLCTIDIPIPATYVSILARREGYASTSVNWDWAGAGDSHSDFPATFTLPLPRGATIGGTIVDEAGMPVGEARIIPEYWPHPDQDAQAQPTLTPRITEESVASGADGRWTYNGISPGALDKMRFRIAHADFISDEYAAIPDRRTLADQMSRIVLQRGLDITGRVVDQAGKPVAGATITTIQERHVVNDYGKTVTTDTDGRFQVLHLRPQIVPVTISAKGFAPELVQVNLSNGPSTPLEVQLGRGATLRAKVVDPQGNPIPEAEIFIDQWRNVNSLRWSAKTDADGRFVMEDAPADPIAFMFSKEGFRYILRQQLTAGDPEQTVTMRPQLKVHGNVVDSQTGQAIAKFRVIESSALWANRPPLFSFGSPMSGSNGTYDVTLDPHDEVVESYVRIEADGYRAVVSPAMIDAQSVFDARMEPAPDVAGTVRNPDGSAATGIKVALVPPGAQIDLAGTDVFRHGGLQVVTDAQGRYRFGAQPADFTLLAWSDAGYTLVHVKQDQTQVDLTLAPWAKLEGVYAPGGKPIAGMNLFIAASELRDPRSTLPMFNWQSRVTTDSQGRYSVMHIPHFHEASVTVQIGQLGEGLDQRRWLPMQVRPGQTVRLDVSGEGRTLAGRITPATPGDAIPGARGMVLLTCSLADAAQGWPTSMREAIERLQPVYRSQINPDGSFSVPSLPPGRYEYSFSIFGGNSASASGTLTIPPGPADQLVDMGELHYTRDVPPAIGQNLPDDLGQTLDNKPIHYLKDFAGKFVVLFVWDDCSGSADSHLPFLNELGSAFAADPRVRLISINADAISCGLIGVPHKPATLDSAAWLRGYITLAQGTVRSRLITRKWPAILIVSPQGKVLATELDGKDVKAALESAINSEVPR